MKQLATDDAITGKVVRSWDELVADGREAWQGIESRSWRLGDLALEVERSETPPGGWEKGDKGKLRLFAEAIGVDHNTLRNYRLLAAAYPSHCRNAAGVEVHRLFAAQPDRHELLASRAWTKAEARALVASRNALALDKNSIESGGVGNVVGRAWDDLRESRKHLTEFCDALENDLPLEDQLFIADIEDYLELAHEIERLLAKRVAA